MKAEELRIGNYVKIDEGIGTGIVSYIFQMVILEWY